MLIATGAGLLACAVNVVDGHEAQPEPTEQVQRLLKISGAWEQHKAGKK